MIEIIPYVLIMVLWQPADRDNSMSVSYQVYDTLEACQKAAFAKSGQIMVSNAQGVDGRTYCLPVDHAATLDRLPSERAAPATTPQP